jgi:hypothetical protein
MIVILTYGCVKSFSRSAQLRGYFFGKGSFYDWGETRASPSSALSRLEIRKLNQTNVVLSGHPLNFEENKKTGIEYPVRIAL